MRTRHTRKFLSAGLGLIALVCVWFFFAPGTLGGSTSYVVTDGVSMEPRFHTGDLALVRSENRYQVGQIVAYRSKAFHTIVLHRIVALRGDRYVFKGDNNNFLDFEHPAASQLIGALWLHIPGAGARLHSLRSPLLIAVLIGIGTLLFAGAAFTRRTRRRRRQRRAEQSAEPFAAAQRQGVLTSSMGFAALSAAAVVPFIALAALAFSRPASAPLPFTLPYKQSATYAYAATASPGPIYPGNHARTGDPLFTHVLSTVQVRFGYRFDAVAAHAINGKAELYATLASSSGWQTTFPLGHPKRFRSDQTTLTATLNLSALLALVRHVEATTAVGGSYTLTLAPHLNVSGRLDALPLHATFSPQLKFALNQLEVQPIIAGASSSSAVRSSAASFASSASGSVAGRRKQSTSLSLGPVRLSVTAARWIALAGGALLLCALFGIRAFLGGRRRDESESIRARYGRLIVPVERVWHLPELAVIDVADIAALVRIAERYDRSILHEQSRDGEAFWVTDESGQFRYAVTSTWAVYNTPDQDTAELPLSDFYAEELELAPEVSAFDQRSTGEVRASEREEWHAGYEAAATYAGSRTKGIR